MGALVIDAFEFCRHNGHQEGDIVVADSARIAAECADDSGVLHWVLRGEVGASGYTQLVLSVTGSIQLMCQRCLTPFAYALDSASTLVLARNEEQADEIDLILDDESIDVIVGLKVCDVIALIEDEVLLAIPGSVKHEVCLDHAALDEHVDNDDRQSPFNCLKGLN